MTEICHVVLEGPCITAGATAWGGHVEDHASLKERISAACVAVREVVGRGHRLAGKIEFHLHGRRLKLSDLDNMAKVVLDSAFSTGHHYADRSKDRFVWQLDLKKVPAPDEASQKTEIRFFELDE